MHKSARVISFASSKGGPGKTTAAFALGTELAMAGHAVSMLDADPNGHLSSWAKIEPLPGLLVVPTCETDMVDQIVHDAAHVDFVLVDLEGTANAGLLYAASQSHLVVIPAQQSAHDVTEALRTISAVGRASTVANRRVRHRVLMSKMPMLPSRACHHARAELERRAAHVCRTELLERTAFREMTFNGLSPGRRDPSSNAALNVKALAAELLDVLTPPD